MYPLKQYICLAFLPSRREVRRRLSLISLCALCLLCALCATSCKMDVQPEGQISDTQALDSYKDCRNFWMGLYALMRTTTSGNFVILSDIQLDDFHAVIGNGNRLMDIYNGNIYSNTEEITDIYSSYYSLIAQCNFFIDGATRRIEGAVYTPTQTDSLRNYLADAYFFRAFAYNQLANLFCGSYIHSDNTQPASGLSLVTTYNPTSDNSTYPGRSTLQQTFQLITNDLEESLSLKKQSGVTVASNHYVSADAIQALQARVLLNMGDNEKAAETAVRVLNSEHYLLTSSSDFPNLWKYDEGSEIIWCVQADYNYHGQPTGNAFMSNSNHAADYIPTNNVVYLYELNDCRWDAYFSECTINNTGGEGKVFRLTKYPGNPNIYGTSAQSNFVNMAKPFRSAELYLIAAEAYDNLKQTDKAQNYLRPLITARLGAGYYTANVAPLTGSLLTAYIRDERHRELIAEGLRLADLKRWNIGFTRGDAQECWDFDTQNCEPLLYHNNLHLSYAADDYRLLWPIPSDEFNVNPQIKGQQNPGY